MKWISRRKNCIERIVSLKSTGVCDFYQNAAVRKLFDLYAELDAINESINENR